MLYPVAPVIKLELGDVETVEGMPATFLCAITGKPRPMIIWYKTSESSDTQERANVSDDRVTVTENENGDRELMSNLTVTNVLPSDTATYVCFAENVVNIGMSNATLTVNGEIIIPLYILGINYPGLRKTLILIVLYKTIFF